jgi:hypothetical protein
MAATSLCRVRGVSANTKRTSFVQHSATHLDSLMPTSHPDGSFFFCQRCSAETLGCGIHSRFPASESCANRSFGEDIKVTEDQKLPSCSLFPLPNQYLCPHRASSPKLSQLLPVFDFDPTLEDIVSLVASKLLPLLHLRQA